MTTLLAPRSSDAAAPRMGALKVALVHDWLLSLGGADRVLLALHDLFPHAPVYTALHDPARMPERFQEMDVRPSWLQRLPGAAPAHRWLVPAMPFAIRSFDLRGYDLVLSSSHACAKGVRIPRGALHICYCHTPMRYAWDLRDDYLAALPPVARPPAAAMLSILRRWDTASAAGVDYFIANSHFVAGRIRRAYGREAAVIHPPVDVGFFTPDGPGEARGEDAFLVVSRLVPYKRVDLAVEAFNHLGMNLLVVGDGPERARLQAMAGPTIRFAGEVSDTALRGYYRRCRALIFPGVEDFGLVPVEAQACGRPVIAYGAGGALESVRDGVTGLFFREPTAPALAGAVRTFEAQRFDADAIRAHAEAFSLRRFQQQITEFVEHALWTHATRSSR